MKIAVVSSYPQKGSTHGPLTVGGASYTKNLLTALSRIGIESDVYADVLESTSLESLGNSTIHRVWKRFSYPSLLKLARKLFTKPRTPLIVSLEAYMFGSLTHLSFFYLILLALRFLKNIPIIIIAHQVPDAYLFAGSPYIVQTIQHRLSQLMYVFLHMISSKIIVFESSLRDNFVFTSKTCVIPHAVEAQSPIPSRVARKQLSLPMSTRVILFFGYIAEYKGLERLLDTWPANGSSNIQLVLAGGPNMHHETNRIYREFIRKIAAKAEAKNIRITGFVQEKDIPLYFSASDCVIVPYDRFFSSSGPLSLASSYEKPLILSQELLPYSQSEDFAQAMGVSDISIDELFVPINRKSLSNALEHVFAHHKKYVSFSKELKKRRSMQNVARMYEKIISEINMSSI